MTVTLQPRANRKPGAYSEPELAALKEGAEAGLTAQGIADKLEEEGYTRTLVSVRAKLRSEGLSNGHEKVPYTDEEDALIAQLWENELSIPDMEKVFAEKAEAGETGIHARSKHGISSRIYKTLLVRDEQEGESDDDK